MATNFPTSLDTFVNPASTDTLDSATVPHAAQHDNINDAVLAVETALRIPDFNKSFALSLRTEATKSLKA